MGGIARGRGMGVSAVLRLCCACAHGAMVPQHGKRQCIDGDQAVEKSVSIVQQILTLTHRPALAPHAPHMHHICTTYAPHARQSSKPNKRSLSPLSDFSSAGGFLCFTPDGHLLVIAISALPQRHQSAALRPSMPVLQGLICLCVCIGIP